MSGTYSQLLLHVVFSTKGRAPLIPPEVAERLYSYIGGLVRGSAAPPGQHWVGGRSTGSASLHPWLHSVAPSGP